MRMAPNLPSQLDASFQQTVDTAARTIMRKHQCKKKHITNFLIGICFAVFWPVVVDIVLLSGEPVRDGLPFALVSVFHAYFLLKFSGDGNHENPESREMPVLTASTAGAKILIVGMLISLQFYDFHGLSVPAISRFAWTVTLICIFFLIYLRRTPCGEKP